MGLKKFNKEQKNPHTTAVHKIWQEAQKYKLRESITNDNPFAWLKADDDDLAVRPMMGWHVDGLVVSLQEKYSGMY